GTDRVLLHQAVEDLDGARHPAGLGGVEDLPEAVPDDSQLGDVRVGDTAPALRREELLGLLAGGERVPVPVGVGGVDELHRPVCVRCEFHGRFLVCLERAVWWACARFVALTVRRSGGQCEGSSPNSRQGFVLALLPSRVIPLLGVRAVRPDSIYL